MTINPSFNQAETPLGFPCLPIYLIWNKNLIFQSTTLKTSLYLIRVLILKKKAGKLNKKVAKFLKFRKVSSQNALYFIFRLRFHFGNHKKLLINCYCLPSKLHQRYRPKGVLDCDDAVVGQMQFGESEVAGQEGHESQSVLVQPNSSEVLELGQVTHFCEVAALKMFNQNNRKKIEVKSKVFF